MFPYIMMATALIFFSGGFHEKILGKIRRFTGTPSSVTPRATSYRYPKVWSKVLPWSFALFLLIQMSLPWRYLLYPGELFWTEEGYRFSWRVMLMEKAGYAEFIARDAEGRQALVDNRDFLTPLQEKMMSTQPDMMLQYAHILSKHFVSQGFRSPEIYVDSYVTLNGRLGRPLVDATTDLAKENESFKHKEWLLPFGNEIKGL
jgi:hypothetical protein